MSKIPLLPAGCYDLLPPDAAAEHHIAGALMDAFGSFGYAPVSPPLLEYTESLLAGRGATQAAQVFRVMDPATHKVMGLRSDITLQLARIAATRLRDAAHPLRLAYAGPVLRMQGSGLRGGRQLLQAGAELIGADSAEADAEVILVALAGLRAAGISNITVDLHMPGITGLLLAEDALDNETAGDILHAIAQKDIHSLQKSGLTHVQALISLMETNGNASYGLSRLRAASLPEFLHPILEHMERVTALIIPYLTADTALTLDATEARGFEYQTGLSFSLFAKGATQELGRGGRYRIEQGDASLPATGFSVYVDMLRAIAPATDKSKRVLIASGISEPAAAELRAQGYQTVYALPDDNMQETAARLECDFIFEHGTLNTIDRL